MQPVFQALRGPRREPACIDGWMDGWMDGWVMGDGWMGDGWVMDGWMDGWMDGLVSTCFCSAYISKTT